MQNDEILSTMEGDSLLWRLLAGFKRQSDLQQLLRELIQRTTTEPTSGTPSGDRDSAETT